MVALFKFALSLVCLSLFVVFAILSRVVLPPKEPRNIPAIPFWVTLLPLFKDVDQEETFKTYIRGPLLEHGAVKIFFASQWNVLVARPELLAQVFKYEDHYQKSGNHKKIPGSVLASFLGENIISGHGEVWRLFRGIMRPGLQEGWEIRPMYSNARMLSSQLMEAQVSAAPRRGIPLQDFVQRYTIANLGQIMLGVDFGTMNNPKTPINQLQTSIKRQIFEPIFMNFPFLDSLGIPRRERARQAAVHFTDHIVSSVLQTCQDPPGAKQTDLAFARSSLSQDLVQAWREGRLTEQQLRANLTIVFVAGQENPQLALVSTLYLLAKNPQFQDSLHEEMSTCSQAEPSAEMLNNMPTLAAVVLESLRLLPPIGQLINRRAAEPLTLGGDIFIPEGTYLGYNCSATNRNPDAWARPDEFDPGRWGSDVESIQKTYRRRKARAEFISFHGGRRACLGERFAILQLKVTLFILIRQLEWRLDPSWPDRMTPAGPICPRGLRLIFTAR